MSCMAPRTWRKPPGTATQGGGGIWTCTHPVVVHANISPRQMPVVSPPK
jgi:hypothetical protein